MGRVNLTADSIKKEPVLTLALALALYLALNLTLSYKKKKPPALTPSLTPALAFTLTPALALTLTLNRSSRRSTLRWWIRTTLLPGTTHASGQG